MECFHLFASRIRKVPNDGCAVARSDDQSRRVRQEIDAEDPATVLDDFFVRLCIPHKQFL